MWRDVHLDRSFLLLFCITSLSDVVYVESGTNGHCETCPEECIERRYWWTTMWGFIVTLVVLTVDVWGNVKAEGKGFIESAFMTFLGSALNPLIVVWDMLAFTLESMAIRDDLHKALGDEMVAQLWPWSKSCIKIIIGSDIYVNLPSTLYEEVCDYNVFKDEKVERDFSEALIIGQKAKDSKFYRISSKGELALLRSNNLPPYDQLKYLRANTS